MEKILNVIISFLFLIFIEFSFQKQSIAGGELTRSFEYPHLVSIFYKKTNFHYCAGGLINSNSVLLAAHCFDSINNPSEIAVAIGSTDVSNPNKYRKINVKSFTMHPKWDKSKYEGDPPHLCNDYDIAIITLEEEVEETNDIRYMNIEDNGDYDLPKVGSMVDVGGWGYYYDNYANRDLQLRSITIPVKQSSFCKYCKDEIMICAGDGKGKDSCNGDSGSPLVRLKEGINSTRWTASGVLSFGPEGCGKENAIGVYTRTRVFSDWIWSVASKPPINHNLSVLPYITERNSYSCYGKMPLDEETCNTGSCISQNKCYCPSGFYGDECELVGEKPSTEIYQIIMNHFIPVSIGVGFVVIFLLFQGIALLFLVVDHFVKRKKMRKNFEQLPEMLGDDVIEAELLDQDEDVEENSTEDQDEEIGEEVNL